MRVLALLVAAPLLPLLRGAGAQSTEQQPVSLYQIEGQVRQDLYQGLNNSVPLYSTDFDFGTVQQWSQRLASSQGFVQAASDPGGVPNAILLRLPVPATDSAATKAGTVVVDLVGRFNYLGPADPADPGCPLLSMVGGVEGVEPAPGNLAADRNFFMFIDPASRSLHGGVVIGQTFYRLDTVDGALVITAFPAEEGLCRLQAASHDDGKNKAPTPSQPGQQPTKKKGWASKQERKADRLARRNATKAARLERKRQKQQAKQAKQGKRRLYPVHDLPLRDDEHNHEHGHEHGHEHDHHHHANHAHSPGPAMRRQLQSGRLLVLIETAAVSAVYNPWNQGKWVNITRCPSSVTVDALPRILDSVREDYAPFNVEITTDRAAFAAAGGRKVTVNLVTSATGIIDPGTGVCGVAYLQSLSWASNVVWAACTCGVGQIPQIISHEVGHVFNLRHDGTNGGDPYLFGLPSNMPADRRWNAIMGGVANVGLDQWSKGDYSQKASNTQDDIAVITNAVGARATRADAPAGCTLTLARRDLSGVASTVTTAFPTATITCGGGAHSYPVRLRGRYAVTVAVPQDANMKVQASLFRATQSNNGQWSTSGAATVLGSNDAYAATAVAFTATTALAVGDYIVRVASVGEPGNNSTTFAFPAYGSVGRYTLSIRNGF